MPPHHRNRLRVYAGARFSLWVFGALIYDGPGLCPPHSPCSVCWRRCEQFTGAEIEAVFIDALHEAFAEGREPSAKDILEAMVSTVPLAQLMDGQIAALRQWARGRAREAAARSTPATQACGGGELKDPHRDGARRVVPMSG